MADDKSLTLGNGLDVRVMKLDDGTQIYRSNPDDAALIPHLLIDQAGRQRPIALPASTILVMIPIGDFGAWPYDPMYSQMGDQLAKVVDDQDRPCFSQRVVVARSEIFDMVRKILAEERPSIVAPSFGDRARIKL